MALSEAAPSPGLTLLLIQIEEMIALNFALFTDEEYAQLPAAIADIKKTIAELAKRPKPGSTIESNVIYHVQREVPEFCDSILEGCRKARYLYLKRLPVAGDESGGEPRQNHSPNVLGEAGLPAVTY